ncbi:MAG: FAD:protein FMN transferase [Acidimicrobiia bacterium]|nr:MAG: FAD:protein FMN transferase [Acidimicrobiia bacterium]
MAVDVSFPAMGSAARVVLVGGTARDAESAQRRIADLEARWSRFLPHSEVSRCNELAGRPVAVSAETFLLFERAVEGWRATKGRFDPTVGDALVRLGYTRTFAEVAGGAGTARRAGDAAPAPGCGGILLDPVVRAVTLPRGVRFDPGGIGKGLAADLVAAELVTAGVAGALVSLGGDLRVAGDPPDGDAWDVVVEDPFDPEVVVATLAVRDAGVATSSRTRRVWRQGTAVVHHLVDPATGTPANGPLSTTVVAEEAWRAEVVAKSIAVGASGDERIAPETTGFDVRGVVVRADGAVESFGSAA